MEDKPNVNVGVHLPWTSCPAAPSWWPPSPQCRKAWPGRPHRSCHCRWPWCPCRTPPAGGRGPAPASPPLSSPCCRPCLNRDMQTHTHTHIIDPPTTVTLATVTTWLGSTRNETPPYGKRRPQQGRFCLGPELERLNRESPYYDPPTRIWHLRGHSLWPTKSRSTEIKLRNNQPDPAVTANQGTSYFNALLHRRW